MSQLVSIIMPAFNATQTIAASVDSVLAQAYSHWELILIDDGSEDSIADLYRCIASQDKRIRLIRNPTNGGVARARNLGLEAARGGRIAFLDSDDTWSPDKLMVQVASSPSSDCFSYMAYEHIGPTGIRGKLVLPPARVSRHEVLGGNPLGTLTVMLGKDLLGTRRFPIRGHEDYALWLELLRETETASRAGDARAYAQYRLSSSSLSGSKLRAMAWQWEIYREQERLSRITSATLLFRYALKGAMKHYG